MQKHQTIDAIYRNGVLCPLQNLEGLTEQAKVRITVEIDPGLSHPLLKFAGILEAQEAATLQTSIKQEFGQIDLNGW